MDPDLTAQGRDCYARRAWSEAYAALTRADQLAPLAAEDLEQLTAAAYVVGRDDEFQRPHERLHRMYVESNDCIEHGYLQLLISEQQLRSGDAASAHDGASQVASLGERLAHADVISMARHLQGRALIQQGQILGGLGRLDEAMLAVVAGEVSPICTGLRATQARVSDGNCG